MPDQLEVRGKCRRGNGGAKGPLLVQRLTVGVER